MRRWIVVSWMFILSLEAVSQHAYRWVAPDGDWAVPGNWLPERTAPHAGDTLLFGDTAHISTFPPTDTVSVIRIETGGYLQWTTTSAFKLVVASGMLELEPASELQLSGSGGVEIHIAGSGNGYIHGAIQCTAGPHRLLSFDGGMIYFEAGAVFSAGTGFTGNPFGTSALNSVVFSAGATYISIAGANPFGAAAPNTVLLFEPGSVYRHQRATAPQLSGRSFGYFEVAAAASYNLSLPQDVVIHNDLVVAEGQFLFRPSGGTGNLLLYGNIIQNASGPVQLGQEQWAGEVRLEGANPHQVSGNSGALLSIHQLVLKGGDVHLKKDVSVTGKLVFEQGIIYSSDTAMLILEQKATTSSLGSVYSNLDAPFSGTNYSYIDGPVLRRNLEPDSVYIFPTGGLGYARPVLISGCSGDVTVSYNGAVPPHSAAIQPESGLAHVSGTEHWVITGLTANSHLEISFLQPVSGGIADVQHLRVAAFQDGQWAMLPHIAATGSPGSNGAVSANVGGGTLFTLASIHPASTLPVDPGRIAWKKRENELHLHLESPDKEEVIRFQWYSSNNGIHWEVWGTPLPQYANSTTTCRASGPSHNFSNPQFKLIRYFKNGDSAIHRTTVPFTPEPQLILYPNPACEKIFIFFKGSSSKSKIDIVSITGTIVQMVEMRGEKAEIDIHHLPKGTYFLHLRNKNKDRILPFLKQ